MREDNLTLHGMSPEEIMLVTPEQAYEWLANNPRNRAVRHKKVQAIAKDIREGKWVDNGDTIRLNIETGELLDGQHRLNAVFEAGIPVWMRIVKIRPTHHMDDNLGRSFTDQIVIGGLADKGSAATNKSCCSVARFLLDSDDKEKVAAFCNANEQAFTFLRRLMNLGTTKSTIKGTRCAGIFAAMFVALDNEVPEDVIEAWYRVVITGKYSGEKWEESALKFRNFLIRNMNWNVQRPTSKSELYQEAFNKTQQSLYCYSKKRDMQKLYNEPVWSWSAKVENIRLDEINEGDMFELPDYGILPVSRKKEDRVFFATGKTRTPEVCFRYPDAFENGKIRKVYKEA